MTRLSSDQEVIALGRRKPVNSGRVLHTRDDRQISESARNRGERYKRLGRMSSPANLRFTGAILGMFLTRSQGDRIVEVNQIMYEVLGPP